MNRFLVAVTLALSVFIAGSAAADVGIQTDVKKPGVQIPLARGLQQSAGLLDAKRFSFNQTLGVTFGSGPFGGLNQYYLNDISYKVSKPLVIKAEVGFQNNLSGMPLYGSTGGGRMQVVVPYVGVLYQPKPNLRIEFGFSNMPSYYSQSFFGSRLPY